MNRLALLALVLNVVSCTAPTPAPDRGEDLNEKDRAAAEAFRQEYAAYAVSGVPAFDITKTKKLSKRMTLKRAGGIRLELVLGDRWKEAGRYTLLRTESRYRIVDPTGQILASAESVMAVQDLDGVQIPEHIRVCFDKATEGFLVDEEHNWSTRRCVHFQPGADKESWTAKVFYLPDRDKIPLVAGPGPESTCLGLFNGRLYFECAGRTFAIPLDQLPPVKDLGYSIG